MTTDTGTKRVIWRHTKNDGYPAIVTIDEDGRLDMGGHLGWEFTARLLAKEVARLHGLLHGTEVDGEEPDSVGALATRAEKLVWQAGFKTQGAWEAWLLEYYETADLRKLRPSEIRNVIDILEQMPAMKAASEAAWTEVEK